MMSKGFRLLQPACRRLQPRCQAPLLQLRAVSAGLQDPAASFNIPHSWRQALLLLRAVAACPCYCGWQALLLVLLVSAITSAAAGHPHRGSRLCSQLQNS